MPTPTATEVPDVLALPLARTRPWRHHPIASPAVIFKYNPHQMSDADLVATFVGREELLERMVAHLRAQRGAAEPRHFFLHGPRGIGKTTMLLMLRQRVRSTPGLAAAFDVVQFSEEERRVANLPSFAIRVLELLADVRPEVEAALRTAQAEPERALELLLAAGGRTPERQALLLLDNFDDLAIAAVSGRSRRFKGGKAGALTQMEAFLASPHFVVVATALQPPDRNKPFPRELLARFEPVVELGPLDDAVEFLRRRAEHDHRRGFVESLPRLAARIDGLNRLTAGNPRLLVFLYDCLGDQPLPDLVEIVQRTVDDLTPMYQDVIDRLLNRSQAAVLEMLVVNGGVGTAKKIAALTYQEMQTVRTFLGNLCEVGLVVRGDGLGLPGGSKESGGRETVFRVHPPLFQIWYEMRHLAQERSLFLVRFFSLLTEPGEARQLASELRVAPGEVGRLMNDVADVVDPEWAALKTMYIDEVLAAGGTLRDARDALDRVIDEREEATLGLLVVRSQVNRYLGEMAAAEEDLKSAEALLERRPTPESRVKLDTAWSYFHSAAGDYRSARARAEGAVKRCEALAGGSAPQIRAAALLALGSAMYRTAEYRVASETAEQALELLEEDGSDGLRAAGAYLFGSVHLSQGDYRSATEWYEKALEIWRSLSDRRGEAASLNNLGGVYHSLGDYTRAREFHERSLAIEQEIGDPTGQASSLVSLGNVYHSLGDYLRAREHYERSLAIEQEIDDRSSQASSLFGLGNVCHSLGDYPRAREFYERSLTIEQQIGDRSGQASSLFSLGNVCHSLGDYPRAREFYERSLAIEQQIGDRRGEASSLFSLGGVYLALGDYPRAREFYERSLTIRQEIGDRHGEASSLNNLGNVYQSLGDYSRARDYHERSLAIEQEIGDRRAEAASLGNLGNVCSLLGDYPRARDLLERALAIEQEIGNRRGEAASLNNLGAVYESLGDYPRAREYHERSLAIRQEIGDRRGEADSFNNVGILYQSLGDYPRARDYHENSLAIRQQIGDRAGEVASLTNLGNVHRSLGDYPRAREYHERGLVIEQEIDDRRAEAFTWTALGADHLAEGDSEGALELFRKAHKLALTLGARPLAKDTAVAQTQCLMQLAATELRGGQAVMTRLASALELLELAGAGNFLGLLTRELIVPCLRHSRDLAPRLAELLEPLRERAGLADMTGALRALVALLERYSESDSTRCLSEDLGPTELILVRELAHRIERPAHVKALKLLQAGRVGEAREVLEGIVARTPGDREALLNLAGAQLSQGELDEAATILDQLLAREEGFPPALLLYGTLEANRNRPERAIELLRQAVDRAPSLSEAHARLAQLLRQQGRFAELSQALASWRDATNDERQRQQLAVRIPEAYLLAGEPGRALVVLPAADFDPEDPPSRLLLGLLRVFLALHDHDAESARQQAVALLELAAELPPDKTQSPLTPELAQRARELLGEVESDFLLGLAAAIDQRVDPLEFADRYLSSAELAELHRRVAEEGRLAVAALRAGRIQSFRDLFRTSTRSIGPIAGIGALADAYAELAPAQQAVLVDLFTGALRHGRPGEVRAALGALGKNFPHLEPQLRERSLAAMLDLATADNGTESGRDLSLRVLNVLYPNLEPEERRRVRQGLDKLRPEVASPTLTEFFGETVPTVAARQPRG